MLYRLLMLVGVALLLVGEPAMADFVLRYETRGQTPSAVQPNDNQRYYDEGFTGGYDYYDPDWEAYDYGPGGYPLYATPYRVPAPVVLPPIIARPLSPQPMIRIRLRNGEHVWVPNPRIRMWDRPSYPDYATSGLAYIPTPTYPYAPSYRYHHHRGPWHTLR